MFPIVFQVFDVYCCVKRTYYTNETLVWNVATNAVTNFYDFANVRSTNFTRFISRRSSTKVCEIIMEFFIIRMTNEHTLLFGVCFYSDLLFGSIYMYISVQYIIYTTIILHVFKILYPTTKLMKGLKCHSSRLYKCRQFWGYGNPI